VRIAVGIATVGRPQLLHAVLDDLARQSRPPDRVLVCAPSIVDVGEGRFDTSVEVILGSRGLTRQRNAILDKVGDFDVVVFFDDDFLPAPCYLDVVEQIFGAHRDVVMVTGQVIADGIKGPGLALAEARRRLSEISSHSDIPGTLTDVGNAYGCNMAIRLAAVQAVGGRFDERLPLYGWLEDVDFSRQLAPCGRIVKARGARGVHLGVKQGRQSGVRLGYSQIANPIYLLRKGTCPWGHALKMMSRNFAANCVRSLNPEPYVDRLGRVAGNVKALKDMIFGRLAPERILDL
jgi:hypothetical protein